MRVAVISVTFVILSLAMCIIATSCGVSRKLVGSQHIDGYNEDGLRKISNTHRLPSGITLEDIYDYRLIVRFRSGIKSTSAMSTYDARSVSRLRDVYLKAFDITLTSVKVTDPSQFENVYSQFTSDPNVYSVYPDLKRTPSFIPNDPKYNSGPVAERQFHHKVVGAERAWDVTAGSEDVVVAILDTGCDMNHPDLVNQLWVNEGEIPGNGIDDDGNDYIDDVHGWDFFQGDNDSNDDFSGTGFHGTSTAGLAGAQGNNNAGVMGSAGGRGLPGQEGVRLMILRVGTDSSISLLAEVEAVAYAVLNDAKVVSMSFGGESGGESEEQIMDLAWQAGAFIVAAGGNVGAGAAGRLDWPAAFDSVMCVGATNADDTHASYSKTGAEMEVVAPGTSLVTTTGTGEYTPQVTGYFTGTSGATPIVAGLAGLLFSAHPNWTNVQVRQKIQNTVVDLGDSGGDPLFGFGRVDFTAALDAKDDQQTILIYDAQNTKLRWSYSNIGDYDLSGEVGVSDITSIAQNFGAITNDELGNDTLESWIDGDKNGEVGVSDITVIANYFLRSVDYYSILTSTLQTSGFVEIGRVPFEAGIDAPLVFEIDVPLDASNFVAIQPFNLDGAASNMSNAVYVGSGV